MRMNHLSIMRNGVLVAAAAVLLIAGTYRLSESPGIWYDEGFFTQMAMSVAEGHGQSMQVAPQTFVSTAYVTAGYPLIAPVSASYALFGVGVLQGRAVMVLFILGFALAVYVLIRRLFGAWSAAWTLLLLATFPMLYGNGKSVLGEVPGLFFLTLTLLALWYLEKTEYRGWRGYAAVGLSAGLCAATKPFFILLLGALFFTLLIRWKKIRLSWSGVLVGSTALFLTLALWAYLQFGADTSVSSVLADYANPYSVQNVPVQMLRNAERFVTETTPLYTLVMLLTWSASLFARRKQRTVSAAELAAFSFCILTVVSYLRLEGWYRYLFPATTVALVFFPAACRIMYVKFLNQNKAWIPYLFIALLSLAQLYQLAFSSFVAESYNATRTQDMSAALAGIEPGAKIFLYNTPELAILLPSRNYYQYLSPLPKVIIGGEQVEALRQGVPDIVLVNSGVQKKDTEMFGRYKIFKTVDRYDLLQRK